MSKEWPNAYKDEEDAEARAEALDELVHEQASQIASDAINAGEQIEFLLSHGWTQEQVEERLDEMTSKDNEPEDPGDTYTGPTFRECE